MYKYKDICVCGEICAFTIFYLSMGNKELTVLIELIGWLCSCMSVIPAICPASSIFCGRDDMI
jgi:hypothetical protein